ncbi:hypothetical protein ACMGE6_04795 [Macrococcus equi]|uniref:hypothetical protein n=1 Tax=Macrococcus equi TaxID=3395462 RepID=UPI0039BE6281
MNREQAVSIIKRVNDLYPNINMTQEMAKVWADYLQQCDFKRTNDRLTYHYTNSRYKPHITDIAVRIVVNEAEIESKQIQEDIAKNNLDKVEDKHLSDLITLKEAIRNELYQ